MTTTLKLAGMLEQRYGIEAEDNMRQKHMGPRPPKPTDTNDPKVIEILTDAALLRVRIRDLEDQVKALRKQAQPAALSKRHGVALHDVLFILNNSGKPLP